MKLRAIALIGFLFVLTVAANAQATRADLPAPDNFLGIATFSLWDGDAPGALGKEQADVPTITVFRPWPASTNGTAVIIAPGGGYMGLAANHEGRQVADWFTARGVTAFVLKYRLGQKYLYPIPLTDAQRAIRMVRARAKEFSIAPDRIGMIGFSAGGHLTAAAGAMFDAGQPGAADTVERASSRPDFIILGYAWLNAMKPDQQGVPGYCGLMKVEPEKCKTFEQYSPDKHVSAQTPPTFLYHTTDDELVPVDASVTFYRSLRAAGVPAEMHIFAKGKHGSGLGLGDAALDLWPTLLEAWLRGLGLLTPDPAVAAAAQKASAPPAPRKPGAPFSADVSIKELLANTDAKSVLVKHLGQEFLNNIPDIVHQFSLRQLSQSDLGRFGSDKLQSIATTFNEPNVPALLRWSKLPLPAEVLKGMTAQAARAVGSDRFGFFILGDAEKMTDTMIAAHHRGLAAMKSGPGKYGVGVTLSMQDEQAVGPDSRRDEKRAALYGRWLEAASKSDFVGVQTYTRSRVGKDGDLPKEQGVELTQMGWEFYPEALEQTIRYAAAQAQVPVYVTENGIATEDDARRIEYIKRALAGVQNCLKDGVNVRGYIHWSLIDNFEWFFGYRPKFGLIAVDRKTQQRTIKPSARFLGAISRRNSLN